MANKAQAVVFGGLAGVLVGLVWLAMTKQHPRSLAQPNSATLSQQIDIDVYLDGSGSMKNFLQMQKKGGGGDNYLREFLDDCEDTLHDPATTGGWVEHALRFWRFGSSVSPIPDKGGLRHLADHPEGYRVNGKLEIQGFTESKTKIEDAVDHPAQKDLKTSHPEVKVIITDLYQSNGANVRPSEGLADHYLTDAGAIAIYGIRNPYSTDAPVEDLPALNGASLPAGAADTMPFYIIIAGDNAADVYHVQETLMRGPTGPTLKSAFDAQRAFVVYFAKDPGSRLASAGQNDGTIQVEWVDENDAHKRIGTGDLEEDVYAPTALLRIRDGSGRVKFRAPGTMAHAKGQGVQQASGPMPARTDPDYEISAQAEALKHPQIGEALAVRTKAYLDGRQADDKGAERAVKAEPCEDGATICATFNKRLLSSTNVPYLFEFDLIANRHSGAMDSGSELMKLWNIEDKEELQIAAEGGHAAFPAIRTIRGEHPGRTPRLAEFMQVLQNRLFQTKSVDVNPVRIATYDLYVEAR